MSRAKDVVEKLLLSAGITVNGGRSYDIQVHDERFYRKALNRRELGIGEAYMDGWWSSKKLDETICRLLIAGTRERLGLSLPLIKAFTIAALTNQQETRRAYKNAEAHYNIGNDLYERMLDKRMIYSCAYWQGAKTLDQAQEAKLDRVCMKLHLKKGMTLLDIGCGWGGFAEYAARKYGVKVTGITPSAEQVKVAREHTKSQDVHILQKDYREVGGKYDRIVSIGMLEHVGPKNYRLFFGLCNRLLAEDGIMLHHTIGSLKSARSTNPWVQKYIFPGGVIPSLAQINKATEDRLIIEDIENFGPDYDKTLLAWYKNFVRHYPELNKKYDERFYRMWEFYLLSFAGVFRARQLQLWQIVFRKINPADTYISYR